jgi:hypothetical protein
LYRVRIRKNLTVQVPWNCHTFELGSRGDLVTEELHHGGVVSVLGTTLHHTESPTQKKLNIEFRRRKMASNQFLEYCPLQSLEVTSQMGVLRKE